MSNIKNKIKEFFTLSDKDRERHGSLKSTTRFRKLYWKLMWITSLLFGGLIMGFGLLFSGEILGLGFLFIMFVPFVAAFLNKSVVWLIIAIVINLLINLATASADKSISKRELHRSKMVDDMSETDFKRSQEADQTRANFDHMNTNERLRYSDGMHSRFYGMTDEDAKKEYKTLMKKYHPDNPKTGNAEEMDKIKKEYDTFKFYCENKDRYKQYMS